MPPPTDQEKAEQLTTHIFHVLGAVSCKDDWRYLHSDMARNILDALATVRRETVEETIYEVQTATFCHRGFYSHCVGEPDLEPCDGCKKQKHLVATLRRLAAGKRSNR